jgi:CRISPR type I-E-associated protein CasA/Cse1
MKWKTENFNLLEEDWIPILRRNGKFERVGIRKALTEAGGIRQIAASNPMDRIAILRFLLAILYWCRGDPPNNPTGISGKGFPEHWFSKLEEKQDCFNLLGEGKRFYQDRDAQRSRASTDLIQEIPTGNNFWHFRHSTDKTDGLCPACCVLGLLRLPLFSVSGLPDLKAGINGTPPVYVIRLDTVLLNTLWANWTICEELGDPAWIRPDIRPTPNQDVPLLTGLTLLSRRVWLHEPSGPPGMCSGCGAKETTLIRTCEYQTAGRQENEFWNDPHVIYYGESRRKSSKAPDLTAAGTFRMDRPWPNLLASLVETDKFVSGDKPISLLVVGFATDQAKSIDVWERILGFPRGNRINAMATSLLQRWHREGGRTEKLMGRSKVEGTAAVAAIRPHVEARVSAEAGKLLAAGEDAWAQAAQEYQPLLTAIAKSLSPGFTTAAVQRRGQIAGSAPGMSSKPEKTRHKKGGEK